MSLRRRAHVVLAIATMLCAPALCTSAFGQVTQTRTVLVIHSGEESFPANPILDAGIRDALASRSDISIDYFAEYLESDLFPGEQALSAFTDYVGRKYRGRRIDLVIAMTDTGLRFVLDCRDKLFPNVPIVYFGLTTPDERTRRAGGGITGIRVGVAYAETAKLALSLHPATRRIVVIARGTDGRESDSVRAELNGVSQSVSVTYLSEETIPRLLTAVKAVPAGSVILYIWQSQQDPGNVLYPDAVARFVADAASVPVYGTSDLYVGTGVVGGVMRVTRETGTHLGEMALRILTGTRPQDIPIETARVMPIIDSRQLQRWGIAPSRLPAGARILFQQPSVWERYGVYVGVFLTVLLMQALLIAGLLVQRTQLREVEQQERRSQAALRKSYDRVRDLGLRLMDAQESERLRIARELHDDVSQQLAVLKIDLELLRQTSQDRAEVIADEAAKRVQEIGKSVHDLSHRLYPARLRLLGLVPALDGLRRELVQPGISIAFAHGNVPRVLGPDLTLCLFRIVQEALQNVLKHSQAHTVSVDLRGTPDGIGLTIVDDGVGFEVDRALGNGLGLISMQERVESLGGILVIRSSPGAGTRLEVTVPAPAVYDAEATAV